jgi:hypothetical protein
MNQGFVGRPSRRLVLVDEEELELLRLRARTGNDVKGILMAVEHFNRCANVASLEAPLPVRATIDAPRHAPAGPRLAASSSQTTGSTPAQPAPTG